MQAPSLTANYLSNIVTWKAHSIIWGKISALGAAMFGDDGGSSEPDVKQTLFLMRLIGGLWPFKSYLPKAFCMETEFLCFGRRFFWKLLAI